MPVMYALHGNLRRFIKLLLRLLA